MWLQEQVVILLRRVVIRLGRVGWVLLALLAVISPPGHRRARAWPYRVYKEVIDLEFKLGAIACVFDVFRQ